MPRGVQIIELSARLAPVASLTAPGKMKQKNILVLVHFICQSNEPVTTVVPGSTAT